MILNTTSIRLLTFYFLLGTYLNAFAAPYDVYAVKTAFLYRSLHYVEWRTDDTATQNSINICFVHSNKFTDTITSLNKRTINEFTISLRKIPSYSDTDNCNVLYISPDNPQLVSAIISSLKNKNLLTVSDRTGLAAEGVIINFPIDNQKVSVEINIDAANEHNIKFSAKLLRSAKIFGKN